ncbi:MAG: NAD-dependent epimerase/dehydratase family protein [Bacteroidetes bacterium]|nr:NAD-dependent epimerase/dehydratase family protein [Bacteroidota bacterium]
MKILVTGSAGFIGMHLSLLLSEQGHEVIGLDNINSYYDTTLKYNRLKEQGILTENIIYNKLISGNSNIKFIKLDLQDADNLHTLFVKQNFDVIINLAAQAGVRYSITNPKDYIDSNIIGFFNVLEACRNCSVKHLLFASSSSVYGNSNNFPISENELTDKPISLYAATKKSNELMAYTYYHLFGINTIGLRFFTVYGPWGRPDMALFKFTKSILEGKPIKLFNKGKLRRDFTYIDDIINAINKILNKTIIENEVKPKYDIINIGNGNPIHLLDFVNAIEKATKKLAIIELDEMQDGDVFETYACTKKLKFNFDYLPKVSLEEGINEFVKWYINHFLLK